VTEARASAKQNLSRAAFVYYSNETVPEAMSSENYQAFFRILDQSKSGSATEIHEALVVDAADAGQIFWRDVKALQGASKQANVPLFVFSNALTLRNQYLMFEPRGEAPAVRHFGFTTADDNPLLRLSPLSRPEYLRSALNATLQQFSNDFVSIAMIVKSHGSYGIPLMPRVNFDFTSANDSDILRTLDGADDDDLRMPEVKLQGISQIAFWRILGEVSNASRARFSFVFLSSCESGPLQMEEVLSIPSSVKRIVHSGRHGMSSENINYGDMLSTLPAGEVGLEPIVNRLLNGLLNAGKDCTATRHSPLGGGRWWFGLMVGRHY
jgi:hypothetical protein